jgi:tryptophan synthase alpha chain
MSRIADTFAQLKAKKQIAMMPFVAAGFPDLATSMKVISTLQDAGANLVEVGFPFSDPIADGPVIQEAFTQALAKGLKVADIFAGIRELRSKVTLPLVAMVSYSIVFRYGVEKFATAAKSAGFDGTIIPDLPPPEAEKTCETIQRAGLDTILLVSPSTSPERRKTIAKLCSGFVYYLSVAGITGERDKLPADMEPNVRELKSFTNVPVCVGFGIHKPEQVKQMSGFADGAIVGSAFVRRMQQYLNEGPDAVLRASASYCKELLSQARSAS